MSSSFVQECLWAAIYPPPAWSIWQTAPLSLTSQWGADCHEKEHEENDRDVDQDGGVYDDEEDGVPVLAYSY